MSLLIADRKSTEKALLPAPVPGIANSPVFSEKKPAKELCSVLCGLNRQGTVTL